MFKFNSHNLPRKLLYLAINTSFEKNTEPCLLANVEKLYWELLICSGTYTFKLPPTYRSFW